MDELTQCLCCGGASLTKFFSLGNQPPCNALANRPIESIATFPLEIQVCRTCWHMQLRYAISPRILFADYPYRTGISQTLRQHYYRFAQKVAGLQSIHKDCNVLDIGCNDCTLLSFFRDLGCITYGIDPYEIPKMERESVDFFENAYWGEGRPEYYRNKDLNKAGHFNIILATNVLAHNKNPKRFLMEISRALSWSGVAVLEFPHAAKMIKEAQFDTIYHEHISYFTMHSFLSLLKNTGLVISQVDTESVHGGSLRIYLNRCQPTEDDDASLAVPQVQQILQQEVEWGLTHSLNTYENFRMTVQGICESIRRFLVMDVSEGMRVIGFGASGKSSVFLNYIHFPLEYIVDETPAKIGRYSPGTGIPIIPLQRLREEQEPLSIIIFAWNCLAESLEKLRNTIPIKPSIRDCYYVYTPWLQRCILNPNPNPKIVENQHESSGSHETAY